jgi:hypothetical protein
MSRQIHFSRLLDIITGSAFAGAASKVQKSKIYKDFEVAQLNDKRFREIITANLPAFYIVDIELIAKEIANGLISDPKRFISQRFTDLGPAAPGEADFDLSDIAKEESETYKALLQDLIRTGTAEINKFPKKKFEDVYTLVEKLYNKAITQLTASGQSYSKYRNAAIRYGFDLRKEMSKQGTFIATDGSNFVKLKANQFLVISPTFDSATRKVNDALLAPIETLLETKYNIVTTKNVTGFKIGNFVNAGHTSAVTSTGDILGVNMPSGQELQFRLGGSPKAFEIDRQLGKLYYQNNYSIEFTQQYSNVGGKLLDMQFAFVVGQPARFNTVDLRTDERTRLKNIVEGELLPSLEEQIKKRLQGGVIDPESISASPTLIQFLQKSFYNSLIGVKTANISKTSTRSKKSQFAVDAVFNTDIPNKVFAKAKQAALTDKVKIKQRKQDIQTGASILQTILDATLVEQVKQNMGTGSSTNILNLRSGRFAESVRAEKISQSREGMITVFYSYMKNPYATFSRGGRREYPRSRDPKLLISKSIRQLLQERVANKLRSVSV